LCAQEVSDKRGKFRQKKIRKSLEGWFTPHSTLSLAPPQRELREAKEDGIKWKNGMYDLEQSSRRNQGIIVNADQSTGGGPRRLLLQFQLQLRLRRVHVQSAAFHLRLCLCLGFCFCLGFYFCFCGSLGDLDPRDACVRGCVCTCALAFASIVGLGLFLGRICVGGSVGGYWRSILIVDRLYYRIIRLGLFFLSLSVCFAFLFLSFLLLYI
jgi:hypothetical protein